MTTIESSSTAEASAAEAKAPTFDDLPLSADLRAALRDMDYQEPTPVQTAVWEPAAAGRDIVVQARTGTGKTTAFGLPIIDRLVKQSTGKVQALILCPTRELALQVSRELDALSKHKGVSVIAIYGGAPMQRQIDAIAGGAQIVCGTPGRVLDHLRRGTLDPGAIRALVLDEADEMLSMGFERELTAIIERLPKSRQTLLFSATVPPDIERMAKTRLHEPEFVILSGDHVGALQIQHFVYWVPKDKVDALVRVIEIENPESAIVFCNTRKQTETIAKALKRRGYGADWLNGDLPQNEREKVMRATREGRLRFLVATDVAARGIDISHLTHVINCDFPQDAEAYVHRTGRTGRAGKTGTAISLLTPREVGALYILRLTYKIRPIERQLPSAREQRTREETDIVQSLADSFASRGRQPEHLALARRLLTHDDAEAIIAGLLRQQLTDDPELPESAQAKRRAKMPPPVVAAKPAEAVVGTMAPPTPPTQPGRRYNAQLAKGDGAAAKDEPGKTRKESKAGKEPTEAKAKPSKPSKPRASKPRASKPRASKPRASKPRASKPGGSSPKAGAESAVDKADAASKRTDDAPPARSRRTRRTRAVKTLQSVDTAADDDSSPPTKLAGRQASAPQGDVIELHVDVGRRGGARVRTLKSILADAGIAPEHVHRVRVRERYCFVEVDRPLAEAAIEALTGATIGEETATATISERSG